ncbi:MAG TPA: DUF4154 domain-containing protein [bacterium]|nr:DUF4154 domain-containing protein [bacterium]
MKCFSTTLLFLGLFIAIPDPAQGQLKKTPADVAAAMLVKVAEFERNLSDGRDIQIYVMAAPEVAAELKKGIGSLIGKSTLRGVESGAGLPSTKPSILYVESASEVDRVLGYTRSQKILSATGNPDLVEKGITLGFGVGDDGKPKIVLNTVGSVQEGLDWNPAILRIARTVN